MEVLHQKYETQNILQHVSVTDTFTLERYEQFYHFFPKGTRSVLDIGCNTGRGGVKLKEKDGALKIYGLDCVQERLDELPDAYSEGVYGLSTEIPKNDCSFDVIVAGEFLEHLYPSDVDKTICEFQRVLKIGGRLLLTTPNPHYIKNKLKNKTVYGTSHLTQHYPSVLKFRLKMHGFSKIKIYGSGKMTRYLGFHFPYLSVYGSYLVIADKY